MHSSHLAFFCKPDNIFDGGPQAAAGMQGHLEWDGVQALQNSGQVSSISRIYTNVQKEALAPDVLQSLY